MWSLQDCDYVSVFLADDCAQSHMGTEFVFMIMEHDGNSTLDFQVIPAVVRPEEIVVTVSATGVDPPYSQTFAIQGGNVEIFSVPAYVMAVGSEQASKAVRVTATGMIGKL